ncbi:hypothetical protein F4818DRAFT_397138 [Hypoxylon cercidicola]|nr:hypothetical protein F4818DRAFT_397138 [Hypoxylon cercidicola]
MKLIVAGSTGFVATELIRQALSHPAVSSIVALGRREAAVPANAGPSAAKLKSVICNDFENYSESVKRELAGADACVWTIAVTRSQVSKMPWEEVCRICRDYTVVGFETITRLPRPGASKPFRFVYISGAKTVQDPAQKPWLLGDYSLMRGEIESRILALAKESEGKVEACIAKPGLIDSPGSAGPLMKVVQTVGLALIGLPRVNIDEISATLLDQAVNGAEKDILLNEDLVRIGQRVLQAQK